MSITTLLTLLVSSMLIYSAPLIFTSIGGVFSERGGVVNVGLEGIMVMGAFSGVVFNLEFAEQFGAATPWLSLLVAGLESCRIGWRSLLYHPRSSDGSFPCRPCCQRYGIELDGACLGCFLGESSL